MKPAPTALLWYADRSPDGRKHDRWFVAAPEYPPCGGVWRELGLYRAEAWPAGGKAPVGAYCASLIQAKRHLELWLRAHPRVPVMESKGWRASKRGPAPQPDWRIAQYLRLQQLGE
ncbi:hypothetical protein ISP17_13625 [Dyella ginsengisoli]|uniref:Uncharacterized protein n=1 Tax=Dyella ginsengisoli TaxID=363848 RepID=A0ABW8JV18_9GAMM